jgi:hypothetical protein
VRIVIFLEGAEELFKKGVEELGLRDEHGEKYIAGVKSLLKSAQHTILSTKTIAQPKHNSCRRCVAKSFLALAYITLLKQYFNWVRACPSQYLLKL